MAEQFVSKYSAAEIEAMLDKVKQDMTIIQYTQSEINTLLTKIASTTVPTKISDLTDDSDFIKNTANNLVNYYTKTETYTKTEVNTLISNVSSGGFRVVQALPTENISTTAIYLIASTTTKTKNIYDEYINLDGTTNGWEMIGDTKINLSDYVSTSDLSTTLSDYVTSTALSTALNDYITSTAFQTALQSYYTKTEIDTALGGYYTKTQIDNTLNDYYTKTYIDNLVATLHPSSTPEPEPQEPEPQEPGGDEPNEEEPSEEPNNNEGE